jgi:hypothetical protein
MTSSQQRFQGSVRIYRLLLRAYPEKFRGEFGDEMAETFRELLTQAADARGIAGVAGVWVRVIRDVAVSAPREQWDEFRRSLTVKSAAFTLICMFIAVFLNWMFLAAMAATFLFWILRGADPVTMRMFSITQAALALLIPPMLVGFILQRVKPFVRPKWTAPLGIMLWGFVVAPSDGRLPLWFCIAMIPALGLSTLIGCAVSDLIGRRHAKKLTLGPPAGGD